MFIDISYNITLLRIDQFIKMMKFKFNTFTKYILSNLCIVSISMTCVQAAEIQGNAEAGAGKVRLCAGCHAIPGYRSSVPEIYSVPMIGGQSSGYIVAALNAYKKGERKHPTMRSVAGSLSEQDMADIAEYYAAQNAETKNNKLK
jgi:cytochrome c553